MAVLVGWQKPRGISWFRREAHRIGKVIQLCKNYKNERKLFGVLCIVTLETGHKIFYNLAFQLEKLPYMKLSGDKNKTFSNSKLAQIWLTIGRSSRTKLTKLFWLNALQLRSGFLQFKESCFFLNYMATYFSFLVQWVSDTLIIDGTPSVLVVQCGKLIALSLFTK